MDVNRLVERFVELRDGIKQLDEAHEAKIKPLKDLQMVVQGKLLEHLKQTNVETLKTKAGTCYTSTRFTASLADADAFMTHIRATGQFELLDRRANATAVKDYVKHNNQLPPGVNLTAHVSLGVRRSNGKADE